MRKLAKLSLVAAVAVAGLTNVNAASLEEAIKGVDVSGQFRFRAQDIKSDAATDTNVNGTDVEIEVGVKVPVTENVTAVFKIDNANDDSEDVTKGGVTIEDYYFSYNSGALTVNAGQQNIPGRITDGAQGDGVVALYNLGNFTVGAASFITHNVGAASTAATGVVSSTTGLSSVQAATEGIRDNDLNSIIAMGTVGPVSLLAQYANVKDTADTYNLKADVNAGPVMVGAEYSETDLDGVSNDNTTFKAYVSGKMDIVSAKLTYAATGDNGAGSLQGAADTYVNAAEVPAEFLLWQVGSASKNELDLWAADVSVAVTPAITLRAAYADGEYKVGTVDTDISETLGQISYKVSKNLNTYVRYSVKEDGAVDTNRGRIEATYSF